MTDLRKTIVVKSIIIICGSECNLYGCLHVQIKSVLPISVHRKVDTYYFVVVGYKVNSHPITIQKGIHKSITIHAWYITIIERISTIRKCIQIHTYGYFIKFWVRQKIKIVNMFLKNLIFNILLGKS